MKNLILIGGGGHCRSVIEAIESQGTFQIIGILDNEELIGQKVLGYEILGSDNNIPEYINDDTHFLIAFGQIKGSEKRAALYERLKKESAKIATVIASSAIVSKHAKIGNGSVILHQCVINANSKVGDNCIINTSAVIEHDCIIENHCHISTGAIVNGTCKIGKGSFLGSMVTINHNIEIGENSIVASGSLVTKNLTGNNTYKGFPVKEN